MRARHHDDVELSAGRAANRCIDTEIRRIPHDDERLNRLVSQVGLQRRFIEPIARRLAHHAIMVFDVKGRIELPLVGKGCPPLRPGISIMLEKDDGCRYCSRGCGHLVDPLQHVCLVQRRRICLEDANLNVNNEDGCACRIEVTHPVHLTPPSVRYFPVRNWRRWPVFSAWSFVPPPTERAILLGCGAPPYTSPLGADVPNRWLAGLRASARSRFRTSRSFSPQTLTERIRLSTAPI